MACMNSRIQNTQSLQYHSEIASSPSRCPHRWSKSPSVWCSWCTRTALALRSFRGGKEQLSWMLPLISWWVQADSHWHWRAKQRGSRSFNLREDSWDQHLHSRTPMLSVKPFWCTDYHSECSCTAYQSDLPTDHEGSHKLQLLRCRWPHAWLSGGLPWPVRWTMHPLFALWFPNPFFPTHHPI
jgi:hypothetical protein